MNGDFMEIQRDVVWYQGYFPNEAVHEMDFISGREAHVWDAPTESLRESAKRCYKVLSCEAKDRAQRFRRPLDQYNYIVSHSMKRLILAAYVGCDPSHLEFQVASYGKPFIFNPTGSIQYNMTRTKNAACIAVTNNKEIGIDLDKVN